MDTRHITAQIKVKSELVKKQAEKNQICKRKAVGCCIMEIWTESTFWACTAINGPSHPDNECTNEVGNCGCCHAEPKAIVEYLQRIGARGKHGPAILISTYSPCTPCVNLIITSKVIDLVVYEIFAPHWQRADDILRRVLPVMTLEEVNKRSIGKWLKTVST